MGKSSAPATPDYQGIAEQQGQINKDMAVYNAGLAHVNQNNPYGSITYATHMDANGNPQTSMNTELAPRQQYLFDKQQINKAALANGQMTGIGAVDNYTKQTRGGGLDAESTEAQRQRITNAVYDQYRSKMDPQFELQGRQQENKLIQQGLTPESEAYKRQMATYEKSKNDAYLNANNQAVIQGDASQNQAFQQLLAKYNQTQQDYGTYVGNTAAAVPTPQNAGAGGGGAAAADIAGAGQQAYNADLNATNVSNANKSATTQGVGSLIAMYAMYAM